MVINGIRREMRKPGEGFTTVPDGHEIADIEVLVDYVKIAHAYGYKAMSNKNGVSKYMDGAVTIKVVRRERVRP